MKPQRRPVPRPFEFPWGSGEIVEESSFRGEHHEPCVQLLRFHDGMELLRLCSYTLSGRFERNSWLAGPAELAGLSVELKTAPRTTALLRRLLDESEHLPEPRNSVEQAAFGWASDESTRVVSPNDS